MRSVRRKLRLGESGSGEDMSDQPLVGGLWRRGMQVTFSLSLRFLAVSEVLLREEGRTRGLWEKGWRARCYYALHHPIHPSFTTLCLLIESLDALPETDDDSL